MVNIVKEVSYVADPHDISITAQYKASERSLNIAFKIDSKKAFTARYYFDPTNNIEDFHMMVKHTCDSLFKNMSEYEFEEMLNAEELMKGKNVHRRIKTVYTKGGKRLWNV